MPVGRVRPGRRARSARRPGRARSPRARGRTAASAHRGRAGRATRRGWCRRARRRSSRAMPRRRHGACAACWRRCPPRGRDCTVSAWMRGGVRSPLHVAITTRRSAVLPAITSQSWCGARAASRRLTRDSRSRSGSAPACSTSSARRGPGPDRDGGRGAGLQPDGSALRLVERQQGGEAEHPGQRREAGHAVGVGEESGGGARGEHGATMPPRRATAVTESWLAAAIARRCRPRPSRRPPLKRRRRPSDTPGNVHHGSTGPPGGAANRRPPVTFHGYYSRWTGSTISGCAPSCS